MKKSFCFSFVPVFILALVTSCSVVKTDYSNTPYRQGNIYYYLPESLLKVTSTVKAEIVYNIDDQSAETMNTVSSKTIVSQTFTVSSEMITDTKNLLMLNYTTNPLTADEVKFQVNSKGLLEVVNVSTDDRTAEIISKLTQAPQIILTGGTLEKGIKTKTVIKEFSADFALKASLLASGGSSGQDIDWNLTFTNDLDAQKGTGEPLDAGFNLKLNNQDDISSLTPKTIGEVIHQNSQIASSNQPQSGNANQANGSASSDLKGILTRPLHNAELLITAKANNLSNNDLPVNVPVADLSRIVNIPITRTAFVKKINNLTIKDGIVLSNEINKPSSVEGFVSIPINLAKAIVAIPAQLIQFRIDNTSRNTSLQAALLANQKAILDSQKFNLQRQIDLDQVKMDLEKNNFARDLELQKYKLEVEKNLLTSQKENLEAIDSLRKEVDALKLKAKKGK